MRPSTVLLAFFGLVIPESVFSWLLTNPQASELVSAAHNVALGLALRSAVTFFSVTSGFQGSRYREHEAGTGCGTPGVALKRNKRPVRPPAPNRRRRLHNRAQERIAPLRQAQTGWRRQQSGSPFAAIHHPTGAAIWLALGPLVPAIQWCIRTTTSVGADCASDCATAALTAADAGAWITNLCLTVVLDVLKAIAITPGHQYDFAGREIRGVSAIARRFHVIEDNDAYETLGSA